MTTSIVTQHVTMIHLIENVIVFCGVLMTGIKLRVCVAVTLLWSTKDVVCRTLRMLVNRYRSVS